MFVWYFSNELVIGHASQGFTNSKTINNLLFIWRFDTFYELLTMSDRDVIRQMMFIIIWKWFVVKHVAITHSLTHSLTQPTYQTTNQPTNQPPRDHLLNINNFKISHFKQKWKINGYDIVNIILYKSLNGLNSYI